MVEVARFISFVNHSVSARFPPTQHLGGSHHETHLDNNSPFDYGLDANCDDQAMRLYLAVLWSNDKRPVSGEHDYSIRVHTRHRSLWGYRLD